MLKKRVDIYLSSITINKELYKYIYLRVDELQIINVRKFLLLLTLSYNISEICLFKTDFLNLFLSL